MSGRQCVDGQAGRALMSGRQCIAIILSYSRDRQCCGATPFYLPPPSDPASAFEYNKDFIKLKFN